MAHHHAHGDPPPVPARSRQVVAAVAGIVAFLTVLGLIVLWPDGSGTSRAEELGITSERYEAVVRTIGIGPCSYAPEAPTECRAVVVEPTQGPDAGERVRLPEESVNSEFLADLEPGDRIVVGYEDDTDFYFYADRQRRPTLLVLTALFAGAVILLGRLRGVAALAGLGLTVVVLLQFVVPAILDGRDPLWVALVGSVAIAYLALYLAHGVNTMTTVALLGTVAALVLTVVLADIFFELARFSGAVSEEAVFLQVAADRIDPTGLLLAGVIIGALGALDDMTVTQASTVWELRRANAGLSTRGLFHSAMRVGRDHVSSTVNTLLLAYVGASMPLLLLFVLSEQSLGTVANSELVAVEIVRTLVGSIGLVAAVPITTGLAALLAPPGNDIADGVPVAPADLDADRAAETDPDRLFWGDLADDDDR